MSEGEWKEKICDDKHKSDRELIKSIEDRMETELRSQKELTTLKLEHIEKSIPDGTLFNRTMTFRQTATVIIATIMIFIGIVEYILPLYKANVEMIQKVDKIEKDNERFHIVLNGICKELNIKISDDSSIEYN